MADAKRKRVAHNFIDLAGRVFGRLKVVSLSHKAASGPYWECICSCGQITIVQGRKLRNAHTQSCGCQRRDSSRINHTTHGLSKLPEYKIWIGIIKRCENPNIEHWADYGGRGIAICHEWRNDFPAFLAYVGNRPSPKHSIDRYPNNDGNYEPGNVRWAIDVTQSRNKRSNHLLTLNGVTATLSEWSERTGINYGTLKDRIKCGWSHERALTTPKLQTWSRQPRS